MAKNFTNTALKFCNYWSIISSVFLLIFLIIGCIYFISDYKKYNKIIEATVSSIKNNSCESKEREVIDHNRYSSTKHMEQYSDCYLTLHYNINKKEIINKLHTEDINYNIGDKIRIEYNSKNLYDIREFKPHNRIMMWLCIIFLILTVINLIVRVYYSNNNMVKAFIGITCLQNIFSSRY